MCFRWLHCNFQGVMVLHYDKLFKGAEKLTRHHWSMVELKYVFTGAAIARPVELQEFAVGSYSLFRALFLFPVSHWCCSCFCKCILDADAMWHLKRSRTGLSPSWSSWVECLRSGWSLRPMLELFCLPKCTLHQRSKDATHEAKTYQNNRKHEEKTCWKNVKPKCRERFERFYFCIHAVLCLEF